MLFQLALGDGRVVELDLTPREDAFLTEFVRNAGEVVTKDRLIELAGVPDRERPIVWALRKKLEAVPKDGLALLTERGRGYRLVFDDPGRVRVYKSLTLRGALRRAWFGEHMFELSGSVTAIVDLLMKRPGRPVTRARLVSHTGLTEESLDATVQAASRLFRAETKGSVGILAGYLNYRLVFNRVQSGRLVVWALDAKMSWGDETTSLTSGEANVMVELLSPRRRYGVSRDALRNVVRPGRTCSLVAVGTVVDGLETKLAILTAGELPLKKNDEEVWLAFEDEDPLIQDDLAYLPRSRTVTLYGMTCQLDRRRGELFETLVLDDPATYGALLGHPPDARPVATAQKTLRKRIATLRRLLQAAFGDAVQIVAVPGVGYRLVVIPEAKLGPFTVDEGRRALRLGDTSVNLNSTTFPLAETLASRLGDVVPYHVLWDTELGPAGSPTSKEFNAIDRLRAELKPLSDVVIHGLKRRGYSMLVAAAPPERLRLGELSFHGGCRMLWDPQDDQRVVFSPVAAAAIVVFLAYAPNPTPSSVLNRVIRMFAPGGYQAASIYEIRRKLVPIHGMDLRVDHGVGHYLSIEGAGRWLLDSREFAPGSRTLTIGGQDLCLSELHSGLVAMFLASGLEVRDDLLALRMSEGQGISRQGFLGVLGHLHAELRRAFGDEAGVRASDARSVRLILPRSGARD